MYSWECVRVCMCVCDCSMEWMHIVLLCLLSLLLLNSCTVAKMVLKNIMYLSLIVLKRHSHFTPISDFNHVFCQWCFMFLILSTYIGGPLFFF